MNAPRQAVAEPARAALDAPTYKVRPIEENTETSKGFPVETLINCFLLKSYLTFLIYGNEYSKFDREECIYALTLKIFGGRLLSTGL